MNAMVLSCIPPFDSLCVMMITALVSIPTALRAMNMQQAAEPAGITAVTEPKPADGRFLAWCALYVLLISLLFYLVLGLGLWAGAWNWY